MTNLPPPLVPAYCDLRGLPFMPLDLARLFNSDFYAIASGDEFKAALTLWGRSFEQVPAGSLPDDDRVLSFLSGTRVDWSKIKEIALRGWTKCSDGRLYHRVVAEKAMDAWQARLAGRARTEAARNAKKNTKYQANGGNSPPNAQSDAQPAKSVTDTVTEPVTGLSQGCDGDKVKVKVKVKEEEERYPLATLARSAGADHAPVLSGEVVSDFEEFWRRYPRKVGKGRARGAFDAATRKAAPEAILAGLEAAQFDLDPRYIPHPTTWLHGERWLDEPDGDPVLIAAGLTPGRDPLGLGRLRP